MIILKVKYEWNLIIRENKQKTKSENFQEKDFVIFVLYMLALLMVVVVLSCCSRIKKRDDFKDVVKVHAGLTRKRKLTTSLYIFLPVYIWSLYMILALYFIISPFPIISGIWCGMCVCIYCYIYLNSHFSHSFIPYSSHSYIFIRVWCLFGRSAITPKKKRRKKNN